MLKLALTLRWISALVFCLLLAVSFALLAQWQIGRTIIENASNETWSKVETVDLESIATPNAPFTFNEISTVNEKTVLTKVRTKLTLNPSKAVLIAGRIQINGDNGYWVVMPAQTNNGVIFVASGFINADADANGTLAKIKKLAIVQALLPVTGRYLPSEAPVESLGANMYQTLSIAQLINLDALDATAVYTGFLALTELNPFKEIAGVELLTVGMPQSDSQVNWLSAFYAIEWTVFAGFAVFMWWRLLADAYKKQQAALLAE